MKLKKKKRYIEGDSDIMPNYKLGITSKGNGRIIELPQKELKKLNKLDLFTSKFRRIYERIKRTFF